MISRNVWVLMLTLFALAAVAWAQTAPIYNEQADTQSELRAAMSEAEKSHKNIVLDFGANWCGDCHWLDAQMHKPELASLIEKSFVVVHVDVGRFTKNRDLAAKYQIPLNKGIPALAVLDSHGKLLYAQDQGQFENSRKIAYDDVKAFFEKWKPAM